MKKTEKRLDKISLMWYNIVIERDIQTFFLYPHDSNIYLFCHKCKVFLMNKVAVEQGLGGSQAKALRGSLTWKDNPPVQKLLDAVVSIMAEEYIQIARQNPDVFTPSPSPHKGEGKR